MKSKYGIYDKYHDSKVAIIDFDETISAGHLHHYLNSVFAEFTLQELTLKAQANDVWLKTQLENACLYWHFTRFGFSKGVFESVIKPKFIANREGGILEVISEIFDFDSGAISPFKDEEGLRNLLEYRRENNLKTYVVSSSAYQGLIYESLKLIIGEDALNIEVVTPEVNENKTFDENCRLKIYHPFYNKNDVIIKLAEKCEVGFEEIALFDDTFSICEKAREIKVKTVWIEPLRKLEIRWKVRDELRESAEGSYESAGEAFDEESENELLPPILGRSFETKASSSHSLGTQTSLHHVPTKPAGNSIDFVSCTLENLSLSQDELRSTLTMSR